MTSQTAVGDLDLHLFNAGRHRRLWELLGARVEDPGTRFTVWAPNATAAQILGDWNGWAGGVDLMSPVGSSGLWSAHIPAASIGHGYKYELRDRSGRWLPRADPMALQAEVPPRTASIVSAPSE